MAPSHVGFPAVALAAALLLQPAMATTFRWANDGDVNAMDPYTRQETVQYSPKHSAIPEHPDNDISPRR